MEKKISLYKNSWKIYLENFSKMFGFVLSIMILFFAAISLFLMISGVDLGISSILLFAFAFIPLLFSFQVIVAKISSGKETFYNEIYSLYKLYFTFNNKGTYSIIRNVVLTILIYYLSIYFSLCLYDLINNHILEEIITSTDFSDYNAYYSLINTILNLDGYIYYLISFMVLPFIFFFNRIKKKLMIPYFSMLFPLPNFVIQKINKKIYMKVGKEIRKDTIWGNVVFALCFAFGFILTGSLIAIFVKDVALSVIFILAVLGGIFLGSFVLPPVFINYCFIADRYHSMYLELAKNEMNFISNGSNLDSQKKETLQKMIDSLNRHRKDDDKND